MQNAGSQLLINRMIGAAKLDVHTYEEVERDQNATAQALIVVALAGLASGIGSLRDDGFSGLFGGTIGSILSWAVFSFLVYFVGTRYLATSQTDANPFQVMRALGFAYSIQILAFFGFIPILGPIIAFVAWVWFLVAAVIAIRQALETSIGGAIVTAIVAAVAMAIARLLIALIFGIATFGIG